MTPSLEDLIRFRHFDAHRWSVFYEVRPGTGWIGRRFDRRIDAVAIGHWPSDGLPRIAYEIKATRADFLREIKSWTKREFAEADFHQTFFVCERGVVTDPAAELPEGWGLLVRTAKGDKLRSVRQAKQRETGDMPPGLAHVLLRSVVDRLNHYAASKYRLCDGQIVTDEMIREIVEECVAARIEVLDRLKRHHRKEAERLSEERELLAAPLERLAELSGLRRRYLHSYVGDSAPRLVTVAEVNKWAEDMRAKILRDVTAPLEHTRDMIDRTLAAVAKAGKAAEALDSGEGI
jgi:hypothetical protein